MKEAEPLAGPAAVKAEKTVDGKKGDEKKDEKKGDEKKKFFWQNVRLPLIYIPIQTKPWKSVFPPRAAMKSCES